MSTIVTVEMIGYDMIMRSSRIPPMSMNDCVAMKKRTPCQASDAKEKRLRNTPRLVARNLLTSDMSDGLLKGIGFEAFTLSVTDCCVVPLTAFHQLLAMTGWPSPPGGKFGCAGLVALFIPSRAPTMADAVGKQSLQSDPQSGFKFWLYLPPGHQASASLWPLLLVLHGAGETGSDPMQLFEAGATGLPVQRLASSSPPSQDVAHRVPRELAESFVVVSPQTSHGWRATEVAALTDSLTATQSLRVDPSRRFVTGVSMGGAGAISAASTGRFAATAPVCPAGGDPTAIPDDVGVWLFHGDNDVVVPVGVSAAAELQLRKRRGGNAHAAQVRFTNYDSAPAPVGWPSYDGHASWIPAYADPELYRWLLTHRREPTT